MAGPRPAIAAPRAGQDADQPLAGAPRRAACRDRRRAHSPARRRSRTGSRSAPARPRRSARREPARDGPGRRRGRVSSTAWARLSLPRAVPLMRRPGLGDCPATRPTGPLGAETSSISPAAGAARRRPIHAVRPEGPARREIGEGVGRAAGELADRVHLPALPQHLLARLLLRDAAPHGVEQAGDGAGLVAHGRVAEREMRLRSRPGRSSSGARSAMWPGSPRATASNRETRSSRTSGPDPKNGRPGAPGWRSAGIGA